MPLYEYKCTCGFIVEVLLSCNKVSKSLPCPECKGKAKRKVSAPGGYKIEGDNGASTKPKNAGAFKK